MSIEYDGIWRAERQTNGVWLIVRHVDYGVQQQREVDGTWKGDNFTPAFYDTYGQCEPRVAELNEKKAKRRR